MRAPKVPLTHDGRNPYSPMSVFYVHTQGIIGSLWLEQQGKKRKKNLDDCIPSIQRVFDRLAPGAKVLEMHAEPFGCTFIYRRKKWRYIAVYGGKSWKCRDGIYRTSKVTLEPAT